MRNLDLNTWNALSAPDVRLVMFIEFQYTDAYGGTYTANLCTASHDIFWNVNWTGGGTAIDVQTIEEKGGIESTGVQVTISGVSSTMLSLALTAYVVRRVARIYIGAYTDTGTLVSTPWLEFEGFCDRFEVQDDPTNAKLLLGFESKLAILQEPEDRLWTNAEQQKTYRTPTPDEAFKFVNATAERTLAWGPRR